MPLTIFPPPQRMRLTREEFLLPEPLLIGLDPAPEAAAVQATLQALFPNAQFTRKLDVEAPLHVTRVSAATLFPEPVPEPLAGDGYTLECAPAGVTLRASHAAGCRFGLLTLAQLMGEGRIAGAEIQDWPALALRGVYVPRPAAVFRSEFRDRFAANLAHWRWNALAFAEDDGWQPPSGTVRLVKAAEVPAARSHLLRQPGLYPSFGRILPGIQEEVQALVAAGADAWWLDLGELPEGMLLDTLWYGLGFAGCCAWNPARTELKPYRRAFAGLFFGSTNAALPRALQALEAAEEALSAGETGVSRALDADDLFAPERVGTTLRLKERAMEAAERAEAAFMGFDETVEGVAANEETVQALATSAQALAELGQRLAGLQRAREQYASAHVAASNARAATRRTLAAAEELEGLATTMRVRREEFARAWKRERVDATPASAGTLLDERVAALTARAAAVKEARNRYIQTGNLTPPAAVGMALPAVGADRALIPDRRGLRSLPRWWPEGGSARMRVEVQAEPHGLPWEVLIDLRAHAGETGAFNIRSAQLALLDDNDELQELLPVQLTRRGFVFTPLAGTRAYHLYLDPTGGTAPPPAEPVRARQSRHGVRIKSASVTWRFNEAGALVGCGLPGGATEQSDPEPEEAEEGAGRAAEPPLIHFAGQELLPGGRVRVLETGPLLARVHVESPNGFGVRYDCYTSLSACEISLNVPVPGVDVRWGQAAEPARTPSGADPRLPEGAVSLPGCVAALLTTAPEAVYPSQGTEQGVRAAAGIGYVLLAVIPSEIAEVRLAALRDGMAAPPRVAVGVIEERRVVEF